MPAYGSFPKCVLHKGPLVTTNRITSNQMLGFFFYEAKTGVHKKKNHYIIELIY